MKIYGTIIILFTLSLLLQAQETYQGMSNINRHAEGSNYILTANDLLVITVLQEEDMERKIRVSKDGTINYPLIGVVNVGGKTVAEASKYIEDLLRKDYFVDPHVTISIEEYAKRRFAVLGQVQKPGYYEIPYEETVDLLQAIAMAGGYTRIADPGSITVKRITSEGEKVFHLNAKEMARSDASKMFQIQSNDTISVGESIF